ncbi:MAG: 50S ribosomal protein L25/general stress protein Ctc [bacterium]|nr:50S ribosomal protein L25/general stress protein Ctc [bacterium]
MKEIAIAATARPETGKGSARRTRREGNIPAVVYGPEIEPMVLAVPEREFRAAMKAADSSSILNLNVDGKENRVILRELQRDPVTNKVVHMDFHAISMTKPINISLPIKFIGTPIGVKTDGGIMQATMRELEISCLPANIPDDFEVDVAELGIGDSIHVRDLEIPDVEILTPERRTVVVISAPTVIKSEDTEGEEEGEEGVEGVEGEGVEGEGAEGAAPEGAEAKTEAKTEDKPKGK